MPRTSPAQRAEAADILRQLQTGAALWGSPDGARARLLELLPALLADAGALAERERADEVRRVGREVIAQERETLAWLEGIGD